MSYSVKDIPLPNNTRGNNVRNLLEKSNNKLSSMNVEVTRNKDNQIDGAKITNEDGSVFSLYTPKKFEAEDDLLNSSIDDLINDKNFCLDVDDDNDGNSELKVTLLDDYYQVCEDDNSNGHFETKKTRFNSDGEYYQSVEISSKDNGNYSDKKTYREDTGKLSEHCTDNDADGNIDKQKFYNEKGELEYQKEYEYDKDGTKNKETLTSYENDKLTYSSESYFDTKGRVVNNSQDSDGDGKVDISYEYVYDDKNDTQEKYTDVNGDGKMDYKQDYNKEYGVWESEKQDVRSFSQKIVDFFSKFFE